MNLFFLQKSKKLFLLIAGLISISCTAQNNILPLNTSVFNSPQNSYLKDLNNELLLFVGTWEANFQNKTVKLIVEKHEQVPVTIFDKSFFTDQLLVRYEIKENGIIKESTITNNFQNSPKFKIESTTTENGKINLVYSGGNCSVGIGRVIFQKIDATHFYWSYFPGSTTRNDNNCPPNVDYTIYLPQTSNLIFTKQ